MTPVRTSAPGKIVISGEYAVLDGAPAVAMAVDRRAIVSIRRAAGTESTVTARGASVSRGRVSVADNCINWTGDGEPVEALTGIFRELGSPALVPADFDLDTRAFVDGQSGRKLGLGSSAAVTVALAAALASFAAVPADVADIAHRAHRALQGGAGSGVDIAVALAGGVLEYRMREPAAGVLQWPMDLHFAVFWSGVPASTRERLVRFARAAPKPSREHLADAADRVAGAWRSGNAAAILDELADYARVLRRFSDDHAIGVFDAGHDGLLKQAGGNVVYKPCGAGGGDLGMALAAERDSLERFAAAAAEQGFLRLALSLETSGLIQESTL